jgi:hypothetical protein
MFQLPRDAKTVLWKAYAAIGLAICGRGVELHDMLFGDLKRVADVTGKDISYHISFDRAKQVGLNSDDRDMAILR